MSYIYTYIYMHVFLHCHEGQLPTDYFATEPLAAYDEQICAATLPHTTIHCNTLQFTATPAMHMLGRGSNSMQQPERTCGGRRLEESLGAYHEKSAHYEQIFVYTTSLE